MSFYSICRIVNIMNKLKYRLKISYQHLLDLIFPKYCLGCQTEGSYLCSACQASLPLTNSLRCFICGQRSPTGHACQKCRQQNRSRLTGIIIASDWSNLLLRQIIYEFKYRFVKELANPLAQLIISFLEIHWPSDLQITEIILIPVPLHKRRLAWRGFNQAQLLAKIIGQELGLPIANDILIRHRYSLPQMGITDKQQRKNNIQNAFALSPKIGLEQKIYLKNKIIILIDDVCTTTATLEACAKILQPLRPKEIWGAVVARG